MATAVDREATALLAPDFLSAVQHKDADLLKRLAIAHRHLEGTEQGDAPPQEFLPLAKQLGQAWLMNHKNKVRAEAAAGRLPPCALVSGCDAIFPCVGSPVAARRAPLPPCPPAPQQSVKTYVACCISEVLRLFVPEPPYDTDQLKVCGIVHVPVRLAPLLSLLSALCEHCSFSPNDAITAVCC